MMPGLVLQLTDAGAAAVQGPAGSEPTVITHLGLTATPFDYAPTLTALPGEFKRIANIAGEASAPNISHLTAYDTSADVWSATGLGLFTADGTLFAVHSSPEPVLNKASRAFAMVALDIIFKSDIAANIEFGNAIFTSPPATTENRGIVELATIAEAQAGLDQLRALTPEAAAVAVFSWLQWKDLQLGRIDVRTPNDGTTGGLRVRANPESDRAIIQFVSEDGTEQLGFLIARPDGELEWSQNKIWNSGNDGAGSGLDAGLLEGKDWNSGQDVSFGRVNAQTPNDGSTGGLRLRANAATNKAYLQVLNPDGSERGYIGFDENGYAMWSGGAGFDADLLEGHNGGYYADIPARLGYTPLNAANYTAADVLAKLLTVDGVGSGSDADLLDGQHGGYYTDIAGRLGYTPMNSASYNDFLRDVGSTLSENGYVRLSNGLMLCWGRFTASGNTSTAVTFPMAFPNACFSVIAGGTNDVGYDDQDNWPAVRTSTITATGFSVSNSNDVPDGCAFFAVGV